MEITTEYAEADGKLSMRFVWGGRPYDPLEEGDEISIRLVKSIIRDSRYEFENEKNQLIVWL